MRKCLGIIPVVIFLGGCGWIPFPPNPQPTPTPPPDNCPLNGNPSSEPNYPWCHEVNQVCSSAENPCKHNPSQDPYYCEEAFPCEKPQCVLEDDCDCYNIHEWVACEVDPPDPPDPPQECVFYNDTDPSHWKGWDPSQNPAQHWEEVKKALTLVGNTCGQPPMESLARIAQLVNDQGVCARVGTDAVSVQRKSNKKVFEEWHVVYFGNGCKIDGPNAYKAAWEYLGDTPAPSLCPAPRPNMNSMKFNYGEHNGILDTTLTTVMQCDFCKAIGLGEYNGQPRCGCPVRPEGHPERVPCEQELCDQKWSCNGQPIPGYNGNYAQTSCRGHWKTWCAAAPNVVAEGDR